MTSRTTTMTVSFDNPFTIGESYRVFPPGDYVVETDEELLLGLSFQAYRRTAHRLHVPVDPAQPTRQHTLIVQPSDLDLALRKDKVSHQLLRKSEREIPERLEDQGNDQDRIEGN